VHLVGAANGVPARLGQAQVAHLALLHELGHRADGLLDLDLRVHSVLVVEVDVIDAQTPQRGLAALTHVRGVAADAEELALLAAHVAELGSQHNAVPAA